MDITQHGVATKEIATTSTDIEVPGNPVYVVASSSQMNVVIKSMNCDAFCVT